MKKKVETVGIIGGGPSGLTLASLLAMRGVDVTVFDDGRRPELVVGESLVPGVVPVLRRLELEERVKAIGLHKPGVSFTMQGQERVDFNFRNVSSCGLPEYAYNVPRPAFDQLLDERATELGAKRVRTRAKIERDGETRLRLAGETVSQAPWLNGQQPDLLVDSTGRARLFARTLEIPSKVGPRNDVAHFAHYEGFDGAKRRPVVSRTVSSNSPSLNPSDRRRADHPSPSVAAEGAEEVVLVGIRGRQDLAGACLRRRPLAGPGQGEQAAVGTEPRPARSAFSSIRRNRAVPANQRSRLPSTSQTRTTSRAAP